MWCSTVVVLVTLTLSLLMTLRAAEAQPVKKVYRIGILQPATAAEASGFMEVFRQGLRDLGWVEGQHFVREYRYADGTLDRLPDSAAELVRLPVALILTGGLASTLAAKHATTTIPIVFLGVSNPVGRGLVASLGRPAGNLTGLSSEARRGLTGKCLELLKDAVPTVSRVAMLFGQVCTPTREADERAWEHVARVLDLTLRHFYIQRPEEWTEWVFPAITADAPASDALYASGPLAIQGRRQLADFALQYRLPLMGEFREQAEAGALLSYGVSLPASFRRAATYWIAS
jgi:putative ABC transport system substrate-binding protein